MHGEVGAVDRDFLLVDRNRLDLVLAVRAALGDPAPGLDRVDVDQAARSSGPLARRRAGSKYRRHSAAGTPDSR